MFAVSYEKILTIDNYKLLAKNVNQEIIDCLTVNYLQ